jgi:DNA invertase Pin-like site-specific DNA recombinase
MMTHRPVQSMKKRKTAGYARVSTGNEEQATSYEAQVAYYTKFIKSHPEWEFVDIYADDGISGTSTKKREGFNRMIEDALAGKIDLILTKSISRFARNTVDTLMYIRDLKDHGIEVYFEKENIWTFDSKGEVLLTIMSSLAQEESRSISENVTWGVRKRFEDGSYSVAYKNFLGYDKGEDGKFVINPEQAKIVKHIYQMYLEGATVNMICKDLMDKGIKSPAGKDKWRTSTVLSILTNEKYKGAALLQKSYTVSFISHKTKVNRGELPRYYVDQAHDPIIRPEDWDIVQEEIATRKKLGRAISGTSFMSCKLICEDCGSFYGAKVWHSNDPYRKVIYQCNHKYKGEEKCATPHITEDEIKEMFLKAYNTYMSDRDRVINDAMFLCDTLSDTGRLESQLAKKKDALRETEELYRLLVTQNAQNTGTSDFATKEKQLYTEYIQLSETVNELSEKLAGIQNRRTRLLNHIQSLNNKPLILTEWKSTLWVTMIDHCVIHRDKSVTFVFRDGTEIPETI